MGNGMNKVLPGLYVGNFRDSKDQQQLTQHGITHILSIHDNARKLPCNNDKEYLCIIASDSPGQNLTQFFPVCNDFIHNARLKRGSVLIHCLAGMSRSVTVAVVYVMCVTSLNWRDSLKAVQGARSVANPNVGFMKQLQEFEKERLNEERRRLRDKYSDKSLEEEDEQTSKELLASYYHFISVGEMCEGNCHPGVVCPRGLCHTSRSMGIFRRNSGRENSGSNFGQNTLHRVPSVLEAPTSNIESCSLHRTASSPASISPECSPECSRNASPSHSPSLNHKTITSHVLTPPASPSRYNRKLNVGSTPSYCANEITPESPSTNRRSSGSICGQPTPPGSPSRSFRYYTEPNTPSPLSSPSGSIKRICSSKSLSESPSRTYCNGKVIHCPSNTPPASPMKSCRKRSANLSQLSPPESPLNFLRNKNKSLQEVGHVTKCANSSSPRRSKENKSSISTSSTTASNITTTLKQNITLRRYKFYQRDVKSLDLSIHEENSSISDKSHNGQMQSVPASPNKRSSESKHKGSPSRFCQVVTRLLPHLKSLNSSSKLCKHERKHSTKSQVSLYVDKDGKSTLISTPDNLSSTLGKEGKINDSQEQACFKELHGSDVETQVGIFKVCSNIQMLRKDSRPDLELDLGKNKELFLGDCDIVSSSKTSEVFNYSNNLIGNYGASNIPNTNIIINPIFTLESKYITDSLCNEPFKTNEKNSSCTAFLKDDIIYIETTKNNLFSNERDELSNKNETNHKAEKENLNTKAVSENNKTKTIFENNNTKAFSAEKNTKTISEEKNSMTFSEGKYAKTFLENNNTKTLSTENNTKTATEGKNIKILSAENNIKTTSDGKITKTFSADNNTKTISEGKNTNTFSAENHSNTTSEGKNICQFSAENNTKTTSKDKNAKMFYEDKNTKTFSVEKTTKTIFEDKNLKMISENKKIKNTFQNNLLKEDVKDHDKNSDNYMNLFKELEDKNNTKAECFFNSSKPYTSNLHQKDDRSIVTEYIPLQLDKTSNDKNNDNGLSFSQVIKSNENIGGHGRSQLELDSIKIKNNTKLKLTTECITNVQNGESIQTHNCLTNKHIDKNGISLKADNGAIENNLPFIPTHDAKTIANKDSRTSQQQINKTKNNYDEISCQEGQSNENVEEIKSNTNQKYANNSKEIGTPLKKYYKSSYDNVCLLSQNCKFHINNKLTENQKQQSNHNNNSNIIDQIKQGDIHREGSSQINCESSLLLPFQNDKNPKGNAMLLQIANETSLNSEGNCKQEKTNNMIDPRDSTEAIKLQVQTNVNNQEEQTSFDQNLSKIGTYVVIEKTQTYEENGKQIDQNNLKCKTTEDNTNSSSQTDHNYAGTTMPLQQGDENIGHQIIVEATNQNIIIISKTIKEEKTSPSLSDKTNKRISIPQHQGDWIEDQCHIKRTIDHNIMKCKNTEDCEVSLSVNDQSKIEIMMPIQSDGSKEKCENNSDNGVVKKGKKEYEMNDERVDVTEKTPLQKILGNENMEDKKYSSSLINKKGIDNEPSTQDCKYNEGNIFDKSILPHLHHENMENVDTFSHVSNKIETYVFPNLNSKDESNEKVLEIVTDCTESATESLYSSYSSFIGKSFIDRPIIKIQDDSAQDLTQNYYVKDLISIEKTDSLVIKSDVHSANNSQSNISQAVQKSKSGLEYQESAYGTRPMISTPPPIPPRRDKNPSIKVDIIPPPIPPRKGNLSLFSH